MTTITIDVTGLNLAYLIQYAATHAEKPGKPMSQAAHRIGSALAKAQQAPERHRMPL